MVKDMKDNESVTSNKKSLPAEMDKKKSIKFLRSSASLKAKENVSPEIRKSTRSAFTCAKRIPLRSNRKKGISILKNNVLKSNILISNGNKIKTRRGSKILLQLPVKDISGENKRGKILRSSLLMGDAVSQGNRKEDDEENGEKKSGEENAILNPASGSIDMVSNGTAREKNSNEGKLLKPSEKEYFETRKMQTVISMKKNDYKCLSQTAAETIKLNNPKLDEVSTKKDEPEECIIICTPDININVCSKDTVIFRKNEDKLENRKDESDLDFVKTSLTKLENEANDLKSKIKYSEKLCREIFDGSPKRKLKHINAQQMPVFESRIATSINEKRNTINRMESVLLLEATDECDDAGGRQNEQDDEDPLALKEEFKISFKNISIFKTRSKSTNYDSNLDKTENGNKLLNIESVLLPQTKNETHNIGCEEDKQEEKDPLSPRKESGIYLKDVSMLKNNSKRTDSKYLHHSFSDSDATLSNVESIESSPDDSASKAWPELADDNSNISQKLVKPNPDPNSASQCDLNSILQRIPAEIRVKNITESVGRDSKSTGITRKHSKMNKSSTLHSSTKEQESGLQCHVQSLSSRDNCCSAKNKGKYTKDVENYDNDEIQESVSWLRHYERPRKTEMEKAKGTAELEANKEVMSVQKTGKLYHGKKEFATFQKISDAAANQISENKQHEKKQATLGYALRERNENLPNTTIKTPAKRGRPRKEKNGQSEPNLKKTKKGRLENTNSQLNHDLNSPIRDRSDTDERANRPSVKIVSTLNGSALTMLELQHLFFKFLQHGHFRIDVEQPIINNHNSNYPNFATRLQCYDQKDYYVSSNLNPDPNNLENTVNPQLQKCFQTNDRSNNGVYHTNASSFNQTDHSRFRSVDPNLHKKFSNEFGRQISYSGNAAGVSPHQNSGADVMAGNDMSRSNKNSWNYNSTLSANISAVSNSFQSGYTTTSSYQHNFYNNSSDALANNFYSNCYSGSLNPNNSLNNVNFGTETESILPTTNNIVSDINFGQSTQSQYQNLIPHVELDTTMSNGNRVSNISMQDVSMNDLNAVWNLSGINQPLDSLNEFSMNLSTTSCGNETSQPIDDITDMKSLSYDSNRVINGSDVWMNTSMNSGFSVLRPWHGSLPMYNPYLNDNKIHYGSMFSSCGAFTGLDLSNYSYLNIENNADLWAQNIFTDVDKYSMTDISNAQFSGMSSGSSLQENNFIANKAMNLSLPANALCDTTTVEINVRNPSGDNLDIENRNELNSITEPLQENTTAVVDVNYNSNMQEISQISNSYSFEYENDNQNLNFNGASKVSTNPENNSNNQQQQNLLQIYDSVNQRLENFTDCFDENYSNAELPNCKTSVTQSDISETEFSKLRKELAHFTKQWSEK